MLEVKREMCFGIQNFDARLTQVTQLMIRSGAFPDSRNTAMAVLSGRVPSEFRVEVDQQAKLLLLVGSLRPINDLHQKGRARAEHKFWYTPKPKP